MLVVEKVSKSVQATKIYILFFSVLTDNDWQEESNPLKPFQPAIDKIIMEIFLLFKNKVVELWKFYPVSHCASTTSHASADLNEKKYKGSSILIIY